MSEREAIIETMARGLLTKQMRAILNAAGLELEEGQDTLAARFAGQVAAALESAGYVIVKREADQHQIDAAYAQCGMDGPDLALMYRVMVQAAQEQK